MPEQSTDALRKEIFALTTEFAKKSLVESKFIAGESPVPVSGKVLSPEDFVSLVDSSLDGQGF